MNPSHFMSVWQPKRINSGELKCFWCLNSFELGEWLRMSRKKNLRERCNTKSFCVMRKNTLTRTMTISAFILWEELFMAISVENRGMLSPWSSIYFSDEFFCWNTTRENYILKMHHMLKQGLIRFNFFRYDVDFCFKIFKEFILTFSLLL